MAYLGTKPQSGFISQEANQYFTGLTQNYIDLNQSISSLSSVIVLVNGVVQENSDLTLTSSTRITLGATLVSADKVTCIYVAKISSTQAPATSSVTNDMLAGSIANSKLANSSITLNGSAVSLGGSANTGFFSSTAFSAYINSTQTCSSNAETTLTFNTERYDLGSAFNTSTYEYTPPSTGYYLFNISVSFRGGANSNLGRCNLMLKKNGGPFKDWEKDFSTSYVLNTETTVSTLVNVDSLVPFKIVVNIVDQSGSPSVLGTSNNSYFEGYRVA